MEASQSSARLAAALRWVPRAGPRRKPVLSTFGGGGLGNAWWQDGVIAPLAQAAIQVAFIPNFERPNENADEPSQANWVSVINSFPVANELFNFRLPGSPPFYKNDPNIGPRYIFSALEGEENLALALRANDKFFMGTWSPTLNYRCHAYNGYIETQGGRGMESWWKSIIQIQKPKLVEVVTWNDNTEAHVMPARAVPTGDDAVHLGYYELLKYYLSWYKRGVQPSIAKDAVFIFIVLRSLQMAADPSLAVAIQTSIHATTVVCSERSRT